MKPAFKVGQVWYGCVRADGTFFWNTGIYTFSEAFERV